MKFTLVSGNQQKIAAWKRLLPDSIELDTQAIDLDEIQSFDSTKIITDKVKRAYEIVHGPVVVEDVTAGIDALGGLPGPFIKFFEERLGKDALYQLKGEQPATVSATVGYYDGQNLVIARGSVHGMVVAARGSNGFGFDHCFMPEGASKTFAEMEPSEKDAISHRSLAIEDLLLQLKQL